MFVPLTRTRHKQELSTNSVAVILLEAVEEASAPFSTGLVIRVPRLQSRGNEGLMTTGFGATRARLDTVLSDVVQTPVCKGSP
jgi:hypothetical protein